MGKKIKSRQLSGIVQTTFWCCTSFLVPLHCYTHFDQFFEDDNNNKNPFKKDITHEAIRISVRNTVQRLIDMSMF